MNSSSPSRTAGRVSRRSCASESGSLSSRRSSAAQAWALQSFAVAWKKLAAARDSHLCEMVKAHDLNCACRLLSFNKIPFHSARTCDIFTCRLNGKYILKLMKSFFLACNERSRNENGLHQ